MKEYWSLKLWYIHTLEYNAPSEMITQIIQKNLLPWKDVQTVLTENS